MCFKTKTNFLPFRTDVTLIEILLKKISILHSNNVLELCCCNYALLPAEGANGRKLLLILCLTGAQILPCLQ